MNQPDNNPLPNEPSPAELEMILDEANILAKGHPLARSPEQGIADMQARIKFLTAQMLKLDLDPSSKPVLDKLSNDLREAKRRLGEYQTQLKARN